MFSNRSGKFQKTEKIEILKPYSDNETVDVYILSYVIDRMVLALLKLLKIAQHRRKQCFKMFSVRMDIETIFSSQKYIFAYSLIKVIPVEVI